jgi:hypothetical protein
VIVMLDRCAIRCSATADSRKNSLLHVIFSL